MTELPDQNLILRDAWIPVARELPLKSWETHELTISSKDDGRQVRTSIFSYETDDKGKRRAMWWNVRKTETVIAWRRLAAVYIEGKESYAAGEPFNG